MIPTNHRKLLEPRASRSKKISLAAAHAGRFPKPQPAAKCHTNWALERSTRKGPHIINFMDRRPPPAFFTNVTPSANETYPIDDNRGSAGYKREMVKVLVRRAAKEALQKM
jgi:hypothetical protein